MIDVELDITSVTIAGAAAGAEPGGGDRDEHTEPRAAES